MRINSFNSHNNTMLLLYTFIDEDTEAQRGQSDLPKITQPAGSQDPEYVHI